MTSALIVYYSVSGTTRRIAESIAGGLTDAGVECTLHDLRLGAPDPAGHQIVGVGSPVHYYRLPSPVLNAIEGLNSLRGVAGFGFVTHSTYRGSALNDVRTALNRLGATEVGVFTTFGEGLFLGYLRRGVLFAPGHPDMEDLNRAREFGVGVAAAHAAVLRGEGAPSQTDYDPPMGPVYRIEKLVSGPMMERTFYSRFFGVDARHCSKCGRCARDCPSGNITFVPGELPSWGRDCTVCTTCVTVCPRDAVRCPVDWALFRSFLAYNVRQASRDPDIEQLTVEFGAGKIDGKTIRIPR